LHALKILKNIYIALIVNYLCPFVDNFFSEFDSIIGCATDTLADGANYAFLIIK